MSRSAQLVAILFFVLCGFAAAQVPNPPTVQSGTVSCYQDQPLTITITASSNPPGRPLTFKASLHAETSTTGLWRQVNTDGSLGSTIDTFDQIIPLTSERLYLLPSTGALGNPYFTLTVMAQDGVILSTPATITVVVLPRAPVSNAQQIQFNQLAQQTDFSLSVTDPVDNTCHSNYHVTFQLPAQGRLWQLNPLTEITAANPVGYGCAYRYSVDTYKVRGDPYTTISYTATDPQYGFSSASATVSVTITPDSPVVTSPTASGWVGTEDVSFYLVLTGICTAEPCNWFIKRSSATPGGILYKEEVNGTRTQIFGTSFNSLGRGDENLVNGLWFVPNPNDFGSAYVIMDFYYHDASGRTSILQESRPISITPVPDPPVAEANQHVGLQNNIIPGSIGLAITDIDLTPINSAYTIVYTSLPSRGTLIRSPEGTAITSQQNTATGSLLQFRTSSILEYGIPYANFSYYAIDPDGLLSQIGTVTIDITLSNSPPVPSQFSFESPTFTPSAPTAVVRMYATDAEGDRISYTLASLTPSNPPVRVWSEYLIRNNPVTPCLTAGGEVTADPVSPFGWALRLECVSKGSWAFAFRVSDIWGDAYPQNVTLQMNCPPAPPLTTVYSRTTALGVPTTLVMQPSSYNVVYLSSFAFYVVSLSSHISLFDHNTGTSLTVGDGLPADHTLRYTCNTLGAKTVTFVLRDVALQTNMETITLNVLCDTAPVVTAATPQCLQGSAAEIRLTASDPDVGDSVSTFVLASIPAVGKLCSKPGICGCAAFTVGTVVPSKMYYFYPATGGFGSSGTTFIANATDTFGVSTLFTSGPYNPNQIPCRVSC